MTRERSCHSGERGSLSLCHSEELRSEESLGRCFKRGEKILRCAQNDNGGRRGMTMGGQNDGGREKRFFAALRMTMGGRRGMTGREAQSDRGGSK